MGTGTHRLEWAPLCQRSSGRSFWTGPKGGWAFTPKGGLGGSEVGGWQGDFLPGHQGLDIPSRRAPSLTLVGTAD